MLDILEKYYNDGLLQKQTHPYHDLTIWNYSPKVQYEKLWDDVTLMCRGLVTNSEGEIIAQPFKKFFNYQELTPNQIPNESFEVFEKMDGSLGILFNYKKEWILSTRGSFTSDQSIKGFELLKKYRYDRLIEGFTYLFEIIYPENRIVCQYDYEDLILLAVIDNSDGYELSIHDDNIHLEGIRFRNLYNNLGFKLVKKYDGINDYTTLKSIISDDAEGFVIRFKNGFRMKIKGEEYCRLHKILTNISNRDIWNHLKDKKPLNDILEKVPDEFYDWVKMTKAELELQFDIIEREYKRIFNVVMKSPNLDRKKFAEIALKYKYPKLLFLLYDNRKYDHIIWDLIYPSFSKPFKKDNDV